MKISILSQAKHLFMASMWREARHLSIIVSCCFASMTSVMSQNFNISPSLTITDTAYCGTSVYEFPFYISNPNSTDLDLSYKVVSNTLPGFACWDYDFCDWEVCRPNYLPSGTIHPAVKIPSNSQNCFGGLLKCELKLSVYPGNNKGQGSLVINIFETTAASNSVTVTWNIYGCLTGANCSSGIVEPLDNSNFIVFPNPAEDFINVEITNGYKPYGSIQVYNIVGEKLINYSEIKNNITKIDLTKLPAGGYFIKYNSGESMSVKKFFKTS